MTSIQPPRQRYVKRAIADAIITALANDSALNAIRLFVRGGTPMPVPSHLYPFIEVIVAEEGENGELTGNYYEQVYTGLITVSVQLLQQPGGADWLEKLGERTARLPSYDLVEELVVAIVSRLQRAEYRDLNSLVVGDDAPGAPETGSAEAVTAFRLTGPRTFGLDSDERTNNWDNFASIPFEVETERRR